MREGERVKGRDKGEGGRQGKREGVREGGIDEKRAIITTINISIQSHNSFFFY